MRVASSGRRLGVAVFLVAVALSVSAMASSLRQGSSGGTAAVNGPLPGQVLWTYYETTEPAFPCPGPDPDGCDHGGNGDNILRLVNPDGSANSLLGGGEQPVCAMIYVFDDDEEMGECCGCPLTPGQLGTFSVGASLTLKLGCSGRTRGRRPRQRYDLNRRRGARSCSGRIGSRQ